MLIMDNQYCNELSMTIELDTTLAQAEVLFLSFAQLVADYDRRHAEAKAVKSSSNDMRRRHQTKNPANSNDTSGKLPLLSLDLRELLESGR